MNVLRSVALCMLVAFMACAAVSVPMAEAAPPPGKGNSMKGGGKGHKGEERGRQRGRASSHEESAAPASLVAAGITALAAREIALGYNLSCAPLPPGIRKNLARGKPLPPGIAKKQVPGRMLGRLPMHPGYEWRVMGKDLVLVAIATSIVADVLQDVFE